MNIEYKILRKPRRKTLCISISSDNQVRIKANNSISEKEILAFLRDKQAWIQKTLQFNQSVRNPFIPKQFVSGEKFLILGKQYNLTVCQSTCLKINLQEQCLDAGVPESFLNSPEYLKNKLISWYKCSAYEVIFQRVNIYKPILNVKVKEIMIRNLKRAWANCSTRGIVTFSWRLLMAPLEIIDYVVVHELAHLIHHNHSPRFWKTVEAVMPDYKKAKAWLKINENTFLW
ncbi:MAG: M48 family metallopeptidase [Candidatus Omnitrophica bacterium]|nr:M48 family metallopeptidase [Candidatus Omnitrophota bacterium]